MFRGTLIILAALLAGGLWADARPVELPLHRPAFEDFLERMETRHSGRVYSTTRPRQNRQLRWQGGDEGLRGLEAEYLRYDREHMVRDHIMGGVSLFDQEEWRSNTGQSPRGWPRLFGTLFRDEYNFYSYVSQAERFGFSFQPVYGYEVIETDDERGQVSRFTGGFRIETGYANSLYGMVDFRDHTEAGNAPYDSRGDLYEDRWALVELKGESSTSYNLSESQLQYYGRNLSVTAGRGRHHWGPGYFGGLILNRNTPPFDYARFDASVDLVNYTFLHGFLESLTPADTLYVNPDGRPRTVNAQKYLSAQRVELKFRDQAEFGLSQAVVYGDRGLQLGYLTPLNFLYSVQHSNDDKDNLMIALDAKWRPVRGLKLYGEFLFDDFRLGDLFSATGGSSKHAYTLGMHGIVPRPFLEKFDLRVEYTKIRPFVYSHFFDVNMYSHWTSPLGYTREPNSEFVHLRLGASFFPLFVAAGYSRQNHGANTSERNVGGSISAGNYADSDVDFRFLDGAFEHTDRLYLSARYEVLPGLNLLCDLARVKQSRRADRSEWKAGFGWNL